MTNRFPLFTATDLADIESPASLDNALSLKYRVVASGTSGDYQGTEAYLLRPIEVGDSTDVIFITRDYGSCTHCDSWQSVTSGLPWSLDKKKPENIERRQKALREIVPFLNDLILSGSAYPSLRAADAALRSRISNWRLNASTWKWERIATPKPGNQDECSIGDPCLEEVEAIGDLLEDLQPLIEGENAE